MIVAAAAVAVCQFFAEYDGDGVHLIVAGQEKESLFPGVAQGLSAGANFLADKFFLSGEYQGDYALQRLVGNQVFQIFFLLKIIEI